MYSISWDQKRTIKIYEMEVPIPDMPPLGEMINYGEIAPFVPTDKVDVSRATPLELERWATRQFHKIHHGEWQLIGGKPVYINGWHYFHLNFWSLESGRHPSFRWHDAEWFYFWDMCFRDDKCYGMIDLKPRRVGDTEKRLSVFYQYAMTRRGKKIGMQNKDDDTCEQDFNRIVNAHENMHPVMRPYAYTNKNELLFDEPKERQTKNNIKEKYISLYNESEDIDYIKSRIIYMPSTKNKFDGWELDMYGLGEFGKLVRSSALDIWDIVRPCLELKGGAKIRGKAIFETTVEDYKKKSGAESVESLENSRILWDQSNSQQRDNNGRTVSGFYRIFRDYITCADYDEFGFPKRKENKEFVENQLSNVRDDIKKQISIRRKFPTSIEDCFLSQGGTAFDLDKVSMRRLQLQMGLDYKNVERERGYNFPRPVEGNFYEKDGKVMFEAMEGGKFKIIEHPERENAISLRGGRPAPVNRYRYAMGIDPVDHTAGYDRNSKPAMALFKFFDVMDEDETPYVEVDGERVYEPGEMKSNLWVAIYLHRPHDPDEFYHDMLMCARYYSCPIYAENNKPGIFSYFKRLGYNNYIHYGSKDKPGIPATGPVINQYVSLLKGYASKNINAIHFIEILTEMSTFTGERKNRTKHDLMVACGYSLLAEQKNAGKKPVELDIAQSWFPNHGL